MARGGSATSREWQIAFFRTGKDVPGRAWLQTLDKDVRRQYLIWLAALRTWKPGPYALPASVPWWRAMKDEMKGIYEMRDQHGKTNYRLFCLLDAKAPLHGLSSPVVLVLDGASKPEETKMNEREYRRVRGYRDAYLETDPRPIAQPMGSEVWFPPTSK
jgi:hypothetical protein